jgi:hypothetical protein
LDIIYAWQSLFVAVVIVGLTQGVKTGIEAWLLLKNKEKGKTGKELRAEVALLDKLVLPLVPLIAGALIAAFVPVRPEALTQYVTQHGHGSKLAYAMWGAVVGQFSDYLYQRVKRLLPGDALRTSNPPVVHPPQEPTPGGAEAVSSDNPRSTP